MAVETSLPALLNTLTQSLSSAIESVPDSSTTIPPADGISLLDVKNELLLSYLQNLAFLILLKLRHRNRNSNVEDSELNINDQVVKKLVELRIYIEKGVRPLENRLKYQIDKVLRAADDAARAAAPTPILEKKKKTVDARSSDEEVSEDSEESDEESDEDAIASSKVGEEISDLQYRPNPSSLVRPIVNDYAEEDSRTSSSGVYRPPRIAATAMPTTERATRAERKPHKSATLDEFVATELSSAPIAEPSIGSTIVAGGRRGMSEKERAEQRERREYEETNYVRLPKETKKERAKKAKGRRQDALGFGGEEWRGLGAGADRIERLTARKSGEGRSVLEKSRKRAIEDGPRDTGAPEIGDRYRKKLRLLETGRKDRGRRK
ncbi:hypothetical protein F5884DRAFT_420113 [Xylogone sp. PMI_703]|nr:hypothetical protein F5884DRAFT_420113 [Xylogone sp. PMI_703]